MTHPVMSALVILTGVMAASVGFLLTRSRLRAAGRTYRKVGILYDTMPEGWSSWFFEGFSGLAIGAYWLRTVILLVVWLVTGFWFIGFGLRLL